MPKIVASKEDWIKLGYQLFSESGEKGLVVDKMSKLLNCNKSSFYWHFKTKPDFINCLVDYWRSNDTIGIINKVNKEVQAKDKLLKLIEIIFRKDSNLDFNFYLKKYAQSNNRIKTSVDKIDKERINFAMALLIDMGYTKDMASIKAKVFYKYLIGYHEMIRYKKQKKNFLPEVLQELNQFININIKNEEK